MFGDNTILTIIQTYFGETIFGILFILSVMYCLIRKAKYQKIMIVGIVCLIVFVYNDFSRLFIQNIAGEASTYYRFIWLVPVTAIIAYVTADIYGKLKHRSSKVVFFIGILSLFLISSGTSISTMSSIPGNKYHMQNDVMQVSEIIEQDYGEITESYAENMLNKRVALPIVLEYQIRSYDASISYGISREAYLNTPAPGNGEVLEQYALEAAVIYAVNYGVQGDYTELRRCINELGIKYLVAPIRFGMDSYFAHAGCEIIGYSENYAIYRVRQ